MDCIVLCTLCGIIGSLSNYDDDDDEKTIDLMIKTTALHVHHAF